MFIAYFILYTALLGISPKENPPSMSFLVSISADPKDLLYH